MKVISPVGELTESYVSGDRRRESLDGCRVGILQLKGAVPGFVDRLVERLEHDFAIQSVYRHVKVVDMAASADDVLDDLAARSDVVIGAYGH